jgi:hypothetical protein
LRLVDHFKGHTCRVQPFLQQFLLLALLNSLLTNGLATREWLHTSITAEGALCAHHDFLLQTLQSLLIMVLLDLKFTFKLLLELVLNRL